MYTNIIKKLKDVEKLHKVESFLLTNGRPIEETDIEILNLLEGVMQDYKYGWYITDEKYFEQLENINQFKIYILKLKD
jgi:hypothetical protein